MKVVIIGGGFGGIEVAKKLKGAKAEIVLIDRKNHHLFQPLLYQVATSGLSPADIASPLRAIFRNQSNLTVLWDEVVGINVGERRVITKKREISYDYLVVATGSKYDYFGHPEWEQVAPNLKTLGDGLRVRNRIIRAFESAEECKDLELRQKFLRFVLVGGGPTGVELAGAIAELSKQALRDEFRCINPTDTEIIVVEGASEILGAFPKKLAYRARRDLEKLGVRVLLNSRVEKIDPDKVSTSDEVIEAKTILWTAGIRATPVAEWLGVQAAASGRVPVTPKLSVVGEENIFVIGDAAYCVGTNGTPLPSVAPVAIQQGKFVGRHLLTILQGRPCEKSFVYRDKGMLATIGRNRAIAALGRLNLAGPLAWVIWLFVHLMYLVGFENRILVLVQWAWYYFTFKRGVRAITDESIGTNVE